MSDEHKPMTLGELRSLAARIAHEKELQQKLAVAVALCKVIIAAQPKRVGVTLEQSNKMLAEALARKST